MGILFREDTEKYMSELRQWLADTKGVPLEEMGSFFAARIDGYEEHMRPWEQAYKELALAIPEDTQTLLDLGCGTGLELDEIFLRLPDISVTGIDLSPAMLERLRNKHADKRLTAVCADYFEYDFGAGCFDCVTAFQTFHHFPTERKLELFRKVYSALRQGGSFIYADYLACCDEEERILAEECERRRKRQGIPPEMFVHFDTPLTVEHETLLLKSAGFSVTAIAVPDAVMFRAEKDHQRIN